ncbi:MAG: class I tRNA ligase family protein [Candidatus Peribacteria bacterium]|jgi:leucyl-tRNA synthetase|nr:class I tRNA ligase family protein [Candidatus Peribacteria bacterium]
MQINFNAMEKKRQEKRASEQVYKVAEDPQKAKFYILDMFPYPSGAGLHVGHPKGFVATDTLARKKMLEGFSVLHPMGFDTFGLGTEQYAIDNKMKPQDVATKNITYYKQQLEKI